MSSYILQKYGKRKTECRVVVNVNRNVIHCEFGSVPLHRFTTCSAHDVTIIFKYCTSLDSNVASVTCKLICFSKVRVFLLMSWISCSLGLNTILYCKRIKAYMPMQLACGLGVNITLYIVLLYTCLIIIHYILITHQCNYYVS